MEPLRAVLDVCGPRAVIAGGAARFAVMPDAPMYGDVDVFMLDGSPEPAFVNAALELGGYVMSAGGTSPVYKHPTLPDVQVVRRETAQGRSKMLAWTTPEAVIATFGFTTEMFALGRGPDARLVYTTTPEAIADTQARRLVVNYIIDPVRLAYRANKYGRKGYTMSIEEMRKVFAHYQQSSPREQEAWLTATLYPENMYPQQTQEE